MTGEIKILESCIDLSLSAETKEDAIRALAAMLEDQGFVDAEYAEDVVQREQEYPTGLIFPGIIIALPHSNPEHVKASAIAVGRCVKKPEFANMEDFSQKIKVDMVVLLAVKDPERHMAILNNLIGLFTLGDNCKALLECNSEAKVCQLFKDCLYATNE